MNYNRMGDEMVSVPTSSVVDCVFETQSDQIKDYKLVVAAFPHTALKSKNKD